VSLLSISTPAARQSSYPLSCTSWQPALSLTFAEVSCITASGLCGLFKSSGQVKTKRSDSPDRRPEQPRLQHTLSPPLLQRVDSYNLAFL
jgi:hypothetical protein